MRNNKKGISPLIASVLLIAFTMAIAGIMATWATTFSRERLDVASDESECVGALDLSSLTFANGMITGKIRNVGTRINLTEFVASVEYSDITRNTEYKLKNYNITTLSPAETAFFTINTTDITKPEKLEVIAGNCPRQPSILFFR
jgi:flagellin-like protein